MAAYITTEFVRLRMSETLQLGLTTRLGSDLDATIEAGTAAVQAAIAGCGFAAPSTTDDAFLMNAAYAATLQLLAGNPKASLKLPESWPTNPDRMALDSILDKTASHHLASIGLSANTAITVGGSQWTDTSSTGTNPSRTSRDELAGY